MTLCIIRCLLLYCNSLAVVSKEGRRPNLQLKVVCVFLILIGGGGNLRLDQNTFGYTDPVKDTDLILSRSNY